MGTGYFLSGQAKNHERKGFMKCDIIKDLLPAYIEGLTSRSSNEEIDKHLEGCQECRIFYQEMTSEIRGEPAAAEFKKLDYLKKIKKRYIRAAAVAAGSAAVILLILAGMFAVGFPVSSQDMDMTYQLKNNHLKIDFQLKNGHDLTNRFREPQFVYDDNHKVIGIVYRYKPVWVFNNPFDDVGSSFSLGIEIPDQDSKGQYTNTVIIEYSDKTVTFINGELVE